MNNHALTTLLVLGFAASNASLAQAAPSSGAAAHGGQLQVITTARDSGLRLAAGTTLALTRAIQPVETEHSIIVNPAKRHQGFIGIGGAITDSAAETFAKLKPDQQAAMLKAYYDREQGIGYSLARTTIHSTDFSSASYTYVREGDDQLTSFSLDPDRRYRLPLLKRVFGAAGKDLKLFVSPWSAPAFMKSNGSMLKGGSLLPRYAPAWANYMTRFVQAYEKEGFPIWGMTVQNEPMATQTWESMLYTAEEERDFLKNHLGPTMHKAGLARVKIIVWDHNRDLAPQRAHVIFGDKDASRYAWGMGFHWYETWTGGDPMYGNLAAVRTDYPDKHLLLTEATVEKFSPERLQHWPNAERYGAAMINDFNAGAEGWTDWNILLDEKGGPNHVGNFCFAPLHGDTRSGQLVFTPSYYYIGHFSKYIRPEAQRVSASSSRSDLLTTSFRNRNGQLATVVMNSSDKPIRYRFQVGALETLVDIPAHAIQTLLH
ncbi:MAG: glycoside hydrolase family 30 protein [Pseudomonadota bacterium]